MRMTAYIDHCLEPEERIVLRARHHWLTNLKSFGLLNMFTGLVVTDRRIVRKTGILSTRTQSMGLDQIESKDVHQTIAGRILGYGDVIVQGSGGKIFTFLDLARPVVVSRTIGRAAFQRQDSQDPLPDPTTRKVARWRSS